MALKAGSVPEQENLSVKQLDTSSSNHDEAMQDAQHTIEPKERCLMTIAIALKPAKFQSGCDNFFDRA